MTAPTTEARRQIVAGLVRLNPNVPLAEVRRAMLAAGHQASDSTIRKDIAEVRGELEHEAVDRRRVLVARLLARHLLRRDMLRALAGDGYVISMSTLDRDIAAVKVAWKEQAAASIEEHRARRLAEDLELRRALWQRLASAKSDQDFTRIAAEITKNARGEDARHGLDAPVEVKHGGEIDLRGGLSDAERRALAAEIAAASAPGARQQATTTEAHADEDDDGDDAG